MKHQAKLMRRKVLLSALEEAREWMVRYVPDLFRDDNPGPRLTLDKLDAEIERLKKKIQRLEERG